MPKQKTEPQLEKFFDEMLHDMAATSPAVRDMDPLIRNIMLMNLENGSLKAKRKILKTLLGESNDYREVTQKLQKKYGIGDMQGYIKNVESWLDKEIRKEQEKDEKEKAFQKIKI